MRATRRTGRVAALAAVLALPIAATACGSNSSDGDHDTLRVLQAVAPTSFNQNIDPTRTFIRVDANVLETATRFVGTGEDLELKPWLTSEWEQTAPDTWRFEVRPGVEFTNGEDRKSVV